MTRPNQLPTLDELKVDTNGPRRPSPVHQPNPPACRRERYLKGPVPMAWLQSAAGIPGKALAVGVGLWHLKGFQGGNEYTVSPTRRLWEKMGVSRQALYRALESLELAGLVEVTRREGANPQVTIVPWSTPLENT
jgi:hypothetical protein